MSRMEARIGRTPATQVVVRRVDLSEDHPVQQPAPSPAVAPAPLKRIPRREIVTLRQYMWSGSYKAAA